jgi:hypothetical protein
MFAIDAAEPRAVTALAAVEEVADVVAPKLPERVGCRKAWSPFRKAVGKAFDIKSVVFSPRVISWMVF